nr:MAG TPA: hypothetical protein [Bacteriophage sp.]
MQTPYLRLVSNHQAPNHMRRIVLYVSQNIQL